MKWGQDNEENAFKCFYAEEVSKHQTFKAEKCGTFLGKIKSYIAASLDGIVTCKCHGKGLIEIKCPYSIREKKISESVRESDFLITNYNGRVTLYRNHKYYTQVISQMAIAETVFCYFVVWTPKETFMEKIIFNRNHWEKVLINLDIFIKPLYTRHY